MSEPTKNQNNIESPFFKTTYLKALKDEINANEKLPRKANSLCLNRELVDAAYRVGANTGVIKSRQGLNRLAEAGLALFVKLYDEPPKQTQLFFQQNNKIIKNVLIKVEDLRPKERIELKTIKTSLESIAAQLENPNLKRPKRVQLMTKLQSLVEKADVYSKLTQDPDIPILLARIDKGIS